LLDANFALLYTILNDSITIKVIKEKEKEKLNMAVLSSHHLQSRVNKIYDHLYANAPSRTPAGICAEVGKILHSGIYWEETTKKHPAFDYNLQEIQALTTLESPTCREMASSVRSTFLEMNDCWHLYELPAEINLSDLDIGFTVAQLSGLYLSDPKRDVFGDVIEIIRSNWTKRIGGQFFTDPQVTSLAMTLLNFDPRRGDDLVDITAGTGGFLLAGMNHIRLLLEDESNGRPVEEKLINLSHTSIKGLEVDGEIASLANASLTARLGTKNKCFVSVCDSLNPMTLNSNKSGVKLGTHLCAASNPPFGTKITVKDPAILKSFDLSVIKSQFSDTLFDEVGKLKPRAPDILFLEQNIRLLLPGKGRLAIVMPYQILSGPQTLFVREWLLRHTKILAVIDLPGETFQPHTGTKTSLLVVKRRKKPLTNPQDDDKGAIFMAMPRWIGHDRRGYPVFKRNADGSLTDEILSDFDEVHASYRTFLNGGNPREVYEHCFSVPYSDIIHNSLLRINALYYKPFNNSPENCSDIPRKDRPEWHTKRLRDVVQKIFYPGRFRRAYIDQVPGAVPFFGGSNITELITTGNKWLRQDDPNLEMLKVKAGWILITRSGSTGIVSSVPQAWDGCAMSEHVIRIVPDAEKLDPHYLIAFLRTNYAQEIIKRGVFGSVIDEITPEFLGDIEIHIPSSEKILKQIGKKVRQAETARQEAIEGHVQAVDQLERMLL
jgi:type I restriction enzyme M protein